MGVAGFRIGQARGGPPALAYLVHDLNDPAIARRLTMLASLPAVSVIGFRRGGAARDELRGRPVLELGRTHDAAFAQRIAAVLRAALTARRWRPAACILLARQLEMLLLAVLIRPPDACVVYECLDIHRMLLGTGLAGRALRWLEARLLARSAALIVSSPAFIREHFARYPVLPPVLLWENKVLHSDHAVAPRNAAPPAGPPWRIGWFGVLRCRRSLVLLIELARRHPGRVEIVLRGRPSLTAIPDFDALLAHAPGMRFEGAYDRATELAAIYGAVHFVWAIDYFEQPGNSEWLLPNRLYEGALFGAVPIALAAVQTGRWLAARSAGVLLGEDPAAGLDALIAGHTLREHDAERARVAGIPRSDLLDDPAACRDKAQALMQAAGLARAGLQASSNSAAASMIASASSR